MIRFCHRKILQYYVCNQIEVDIKNDLLEYYTVEENREDAWVFFDKEAGVEVLTGWTNYCLLTEKENFICKEWICSGAMLWDKAKVYFKQHPTEELLIVDLEGKPLSFCYLQEVRGKLVVYRDILKSIEKMGTTVPISLLDMHPGTKSVCIIGCNEYVWQLYKILINLNVPVVTVGKEWESLGVVYEKEIPYTCVHEIFFVYAEEGNRRYKNSPLELPVYLYDWNRKIASEIIAEEVERIKRLGGEICIVKVPSENKVEFSKLPKGDLVNWLMPLIDLPLEEGTELGKRQKDFYDETGYEFMKNGGTSPDIISGWQTILYNVSGKKRMIGYKRKRIYLVGPCIVEGSFASAENSLGAWLQNMVSDYEVIKVFYRRACSELIREVLINIPLHKQDIIICIEDEDTLASAEKIAESVSLKKLYYRPRKETWLGDHSAFHVNGAANKAIAQEIFNKYLKEKCEQLRQKENKWVQKGEILSDTQQKQILEYAEEIKKEVKIVADGKQVGAIIMNCNPFTNGHRFLIETAANQVDYLYIFIVQEDKSVFPFEIRMNLVKEGVEHLKNVIVVPSGSFILSYMTLPVYFEKAEQQQAKIDASGDIEIFARYIAPVLNITKRFVGEEPTDLVTRQYNEQMKEVLPDFGIELIEIPRCTVDNGKIISASKVRKLLKTASYNELKKFVPLTTYNTLEKLRKSKIVIYGAGKYGRKVKEFLEEINGTVVGWVDKNYSQFEDINKIEAPEQLKVMNYDIVIVAVFKDEIYEEIRKEILYIDKTAESKIVRLW